MAHTPPATTAEDLASKGAARESRYQALAETRDSWPSP